MDTEKLLQLYDNVLADDIYQHKIPVEGIHFGIECMKYVHGLSNLDADHSSAAYYNDSAHRCAYLHKYAALHTVMIWDILYSAVQLNFRLFYNVVFSRDRFSICCLGGGPGNDAIGVLEALYQSFSYFPTSVTIVDLMEDWKMTFKSILRELGSGMYGAFGNNIHHFLDWRYLGANLLNKLTPEVVDCISSASIVTMVKFVSAASCKDTQNMINNIFVAMKPGGLLLFIDNGGGGFHQLIMSAAAEHNFIPVFGPHRNIKYVNNKVKVKRFGSMSCCKAYVTVHILQKPLDYDYCSGPLYLPVLDNCVSINPSRRIFTRPTKNYDLPFRSSMTPYIDESRSCRFLDFSTNEAVHDPNNNYRLHDDGLPHSTCPTRSYNWPITSSMTPYFRDAHTFKFLDFSTDVSVHDSSNAFSLPLEKITQSPCNVPLHAFHTNSIINMPVGSANANPISCTPKPKSKKRKKKANRINRWCQNLSLKIKKVKFSAATIFRKRN